MTFTNPSKHLRFARNLREAYGYDAELERSQPVRGWGGRAALALVLSLILLLLLLPWQV